jgi:tRNA (mo5U34)-methyltransferase
METQSLKDFLDPEDITRTIEGYPAPQRAVIVANKK